jgi:hypothetical protein
MPQTGFVLDCECCGASFQVEAKDLVMEFHGRWFVFCTECGCPTQFRSNPMERGSPGKAANDAPPDVHAH